MSPPSRLGQALSAWKRMGVPVEDAERRAEREQALESMLADAIRTVPAERSRARRRRFRYGIVLVAAAALFALVLGSFHRKGASAPNRPLFANLSVSPGSPALVLRGTETRFAEASAQVELRVGDEVSVPETGRAELTLPSGAHVDIGASTRFAVPTLAANELMRLERGRVALRVPKLPQGHTLSVLTANARVVVHGTRFSVTVSGDVGSTVTSVTVEEGEVAVLSERVHRILRNGQSWRSDEAEAAGEVNRGAPSVAAAETPAASQSAKKRAQAPPPVPKSDLAEQNRLYGAALAAKAGGDDRRAADLFLQLLTRYPSSPLANEAAKQREQALARLASGDR